MVFSFASTQVMALNCGINCSIQESIKKQSKKMDMANHECCHGNKDKKKDNKPSNCKGEMSGTCFHEMASDELIPKTVSEVSEKLISINELPVLTIIKLIGINNRYRPKIPDDGFLKFKANLNLYILKDQFLI